MDNHLAWVRAERAGSTHVVALGGRWTLLEAERLEHELTAFESTISGTARVDMARVEVFDTAGAWLVFRFIRRLHHAGVEVGIDGATAAQAALIQRMEPKAELRSLFRPEISPLRALIERVGRTTIANLARARDLVSFFGLTNIVLFRTLTRPRHLRVISLLAHIEKVGLDAMPIVGLLSFLIGLVLAFQGADQLRSFGAEIYTINLLGVSVLREIGILLTAILVAGRSGSAFTAEIGMMKVNEEVAAMQVLGLDPIEVLVLPRLVATVIALPLLAFYADIMGLLGGALMSFVVLDISLLQFLAQMKSAITAATFWVGIIKAPFFAYLIGMVGCYEGLQVGGSAESVGRLTTKSVVESIFLVIIADAAFSILFSYLKI